jgi:hypothetical protein
MPAKSLDSQVLTPAVKEVLNQTLSRMSGIPPTAEPENKEVEIDEYEGRMKVGGMEKFEAPSYVSAVSYYLTKSDLERHKAKGAFVLYLDAENASKIYKALGFKVHEDEDDVSMMNACGEFCHQLADSFKNKLTEAGYSDLVMGDPVNYKNSALRGVEFSPEQTIKYEFSFFYWKRKSIVVEVTLADIPRKK